MNEFELISNLFSPLTGGFKGADNLEDDCAVIPKDSKTDYVITKDALIENVHFLKNSLAESIAHRIMVANLSDIASSGANPKFYLMAGSINESTTKEWLEGFTERLSEFNERYKMLLIGGDTVKSLNDLFFSCTLIGEIKKGKALRRSNAKVGDDIYLSGEVGAAFLGLHVMIGDIENFSYQDKNNLINKFLFPEARVDLGKKLVGIANSCADISDGLIADLENICKASRVSATINIDEISVAYKDDFIAEQLTGGDDYELVFTAPKNKHTKIEQIAKSLDLKITKIGSIKAKDGKDDYEVDIFDKNGELVELKFKGYEHKI